MLGGGDEHAFFHQAGGIANLGDVAARGLDLVIIEINSAEDNAGACSCRQNAETHRNPAVQSYTFALDRGTNCLLV